MALAAFLRNILGDILGSHNGLLPGGMGDAGPEKIGRAASHGSAMAWRKGGVSPSFHFILLSMPRLLGTILYFLASLKIFT
jgi:hypothetical protein